MRIETLQPSDIPRLIALARECGLSPWSENDYLEELERADSIKLRIGNPVEECVGFIVGRIVLGSTGSDSWADAEIYNICVVPSMQGKGLGKHLLTSFCELCRKKAVENIWLEVRAQNAGAIEFYSMFGFEEASRRPHFYRNPPDDALVMVACLSQPGARIKLESAL